MAIGETILLAVDFLTQPTWHLVVLYAILLLLIAWTMIKSWGF